MKLHRPFAAAVFSLLLSISVFAQKMVFHGKVIEVLDGTTVIVETQSTNRFVVKCLAIKTPLSTDSGSERSRSRLASRVMGQTVSVEYVKSSENNRIVGTIFLNGDNVCLDQVRAGVAWFDREGQTGLSSSARDVYATGESTARDGGVGLWETPSTTSSVSSSTTGSTVDVSGYFRKAPDTRVDDNWSTARNVNPYTGKPGRNWFARHWRIFAVVGAAVGAGFLLQRYHGGGGSDTSTGIGLSILCNDGTVSHAQHRQGACSHHGGIRQ